MKKQNVRNKVIVCTLLLWVFFGSATTVRAENLFLPAPTIAQRFLPADASGDTGMHNCMPASLAIALQVLSQQGKIPTEQHAISYPSVRQLVRIFAPDHSRGVSPEALRHVTPFLTSQTYFLEYSHVDQDSWKQLLKRELRASRPVIVHMADRNMLYNEASVTEHSHVIVVNGMDDLHVTFIDPWDGRLHSLSHARFASAWSHGHYHWLAFTFREASVPHTFLGILEKHTGKIER